MELERTGERTIVGKDSKRNPDYFSHMTAYIFAEQFIKGKIVLDNGSGSGYGTFHLATKGAHKIIGSDISDKAVIYARNRYKLENLEFKKNDSTKLSFDDGIFDVVTSFQVIEHVEDTKAFLAELKRVLKRPGIALISTPNKRTYSPDTIKPKNPFHIKEFYLEEFGEVLKLFFDDVEIMGVNQSKEVEEYKRKVGRCLRIRAKQFSDKKPVLRTIKKIIPKEIRNFLTRPPQKNIRFSDFSISKAQEKSCVDFIAVCKMRYP